MILSTFKKGNFLYIYMNLRVLVQFYITLNKPLGFGEDESLFYSEDISNT